MSTSDPSEIVGVITGAVGAVTGVAGCVLGYLGYRRGSRHDAMETKLRMLKEQAVLPIRIRALKELINKAKQSRVRAQAAVGSAKSGAVVQFNAEADADLAELERLWVGDADLRVLCAGQTDLDAITAQLLALAHGAGVRLAQLEEKYRAALAEDDRTREHIRRSMEQKSLRS